MRFIFLEKSGDQFELDPKDCNHLKVLRKTPPFEILGLFEGRSYQCRVEGEMGRYILKEAQVLGQVSQNETTVFFPLIETRRLEWAVEKLTELCIGRIRFYSSDHCTWTKTAIQRFENRQERLREKVRSACQQSGNMAIPQLLAPITLQSILNQINHHSLVLGVGASKILNTTKDLSGVKDFVIGPEGDFSSREVDALQETPCLFRRFSRSEILRSETALVTMASLFFVLNPGSGENS